MVCCSTEIVKPIQNQWAVKVLDSQACKPDQTMGDKQMNSRKKEIQDFNRIFYEKQI